MVDRNQERLKHVFAIYGSPEFLDAVHVLLQEEAYSVTTSFVPNAFDQIEALQPDARIIDVAVGHAAGWDLRPLRLGPRPPPGVAIARRDRQVDNTNDSMNR